MTLFQVAISGISVAETRIRTTAHNISNLDTPGYSRQGVMVSTAGSQATAAGFIGRGVQADAVMRYYDQFLSQQLQTAKGQGAELTVQASRLTALANTLADRTTGISPALNNFYLSLNALASAPATPAVRQDLIGKSNTLVSQINAAYTQLQTAREDMNTQVHTAVEKANSYLKQIVALNQHVIDSRAADGQVSNDLLDQRDQALSELNMIIGVQYSTQGDSLNVALLSGQPLIAGKSVFELKAVAAAADPQRTVVAITLPGAGGQTVELDERQIKSGELGGLTRVRSEALDQMQSRIGEIAIGLALSFNAVHSNGLTPAGAAGGAFFNIGMPDILNNVNNTGVAAIMAAYTPVGVNIDGSSAAVGLTGDEYQISFIAGGAAGIYRVRNLTTGALSDLAYDAVPPNQTLNVDGVTLTFAGPPAIGDTWTLLPTRNAARDLTMRVTAPEQIAAADVVGGAANNKNALLLAGLQNKRLFDIGTASLTELYAKTVNNLGVQTQAAKTAQDAQAKVITQKLSAQQSVSGVNANQEYASLVQYQAMFQANAKVIDTATTLLDTVLSLKS
jgi:flagellar hook-associated protein 1 FlgK